MQGSVFNFRALLLIIHSPTNIFRTCPESVARHISFVNFLSKCNYRTKTKQFQSKSFTQKQWEVLVVNGNAL